MPMRSSEPVCRATRPSTARAANFDIETAKEECRDARGARWLDEAARNLTCAIRSIRQHPGFACVATLSLALGIGANLAVFGVLHRLILTTLPVREPGQLYQLVLVSSAGRTSYQISYPKYELIRDNFDKFDSIFGWGSAPLFLTVGEWRERQTVTTVTGNYFDALGVRPAAGRLFQARRGLHSRPAPH
jgi:putative ABC transport system permease protein